MHQPSHNIWRRRGDALQQTIQQTIEQLQEQTTVERQPTLLATLAALQAFGRSQLDFFLNGFGPADTADRPHIHLEPSTTYPPEYALRSTVDQIAYDLDVMRRAYQQRLSGVATPAMQRTLAKADTLAQRALEPAIQQGIIENTTVITYFQKAVNVRIIPYAPVAFIGLPLSTLTVNRDLLAIPHEVGHYVFRHGKTQSGEYRGSRFAATLAYKLQQFPAWSQAWLEEIFADLYGAAVGGPIMALGFEDLVSDDPVAEFVHDDGEHPIAALRPEIYYASFAELGMDDALITAMQRRWQRWVANRNMPAEFTTATGERIALSEALTTVQQIVKAMLTDDLQQLPVQPRQWSGRLTGTEPTQLYTKFDRKVARLPEHTATEVPELALSFDETGTPHSFQLNAVGSASDTTGVRRALGSTGLWIDALKAGHAGFHVPPVVWMALLDGSGWAVEGPGSNAH